jgi:hypothetical protein
MANSVDDKDDEYFRSYTDVEVNKQIINWNSNWGKASGVFFDLFIREETPILFAALLRGDCSLAIIIFLFFLYPWKSKNQLTIFGLSIQ